MSGEKNMELGGIPEGAVIDDSAKENENPDEFVLPPELVEAVGAILDILDPNFYLNNAEDYLKDVNEVIDKNKEEDKISQNDVGDFVLADIQSRVQEPNPNPEPLTEAPPAEKAIQVSIKEAPQFQDETSKLLLIKARDAITGTVLGNARGFASKSAIRSVIDKAIIATTQRGPTVIGTEGPKEKARATAKRTAAAIPVPATLTFDDVAATPGPSNAEATQGQSQDVVAVPEPVLGTGELQTRVSRRTGQGKSGKKMKLPPRKVSLFCDLEVCRRDFPTLADFKRHFVLYHFKDAFLEFPDWDAFKACEECPSVVNVAGREDMLAWHMAVDHGYLNKVVPKKYTKIMRDYEKQQQQQKQG